MTTEPSRWQQITAANPDHSFNFVERFRRLEAEGADLVGEGRFVDTMLPRVGRVLDAGCGTGRHAGYLHAVGHTVVGVDIDPILLAAARSDHPGPTYVEGDLANLDLTQHDIEEKFDVVLCVGNVMTFLAASTRRATLLGFTRHLAPGGRAVIGFGAGRGYDFKEFIVDAESRGLHADILFGSWDMRPYRTDSDFLVSVWSFAESSS